MPELKDGEVLVKGAWLSLDPYMRGRMNDVKSYVPPVQIGEVMVGEVAGEVLESKHPGFKRGDAVCAPLGWQLYGCGPLAMQYHVAQWALRHQVPAQLSLESLMACGLGACLGCALPAVAPGDPEPRADHYLHVCKDGPIFTPGSIQWQKIQQHQAPPQTFLFS